MTKLPQVKARRVIKALQRAGFEIDRVSGSHYALVKESVTVIVPYHAARDIKAGTLRAIIERANLTVEEFIALL